MSNRSESKKQIINQFRKSCGIVIFSILVSTSTLNLNAATPGLPFTEDFSDTALMNSSKSVASWDTKAQILVQSFRNARSGGLISSSTTGADILNDLGIAADDLISVAAMAIGDINHDGHPDLVTSTTYDIVIYLNNGSTESFNGSERQSFRPARSADNKSFRINDLVLADIDNDGHLDLVLAQSVQDTIPGGVNQIYLNNGTNTPYAGVTAQNISDDLGDSRAVIATDFDGDGLLDIVTGDATWSAQQTTRLYINNGTVSPFLGVTGSDVGPADLDYTRDLLAADVNNDTKMDLIVINDSATDKVYLNNGTATPFTAVTATEIDFGSTTNAGAVGDINADGHIDFVVSNYRGINYLYLNTGTAPYFVAGNGIEITSEDAFTNSIDIGDVDSDGDLDIIVSKGSGLKNKIFLNDGLSTTGFGSVGYDVTEDSLSTAKILLHDIDSDGDLDVVAGNTGPSMARYYLNSLNVNPFNNSPTAPVSSTTDTTFKIKMADLNNDGHLDIVDDDVVILNNGTASPYSVASEHDYIADTATTSGRVVATGDIDGDGDIDIVLGRQGSSINSYYLNDGSGTTFIHHEIGNATFDANDSFGLSLGDVDNDGDLDLVVANALATLTDGVSTRHNKLYINDGDATPFSAVGISIESSVDGIDTKAIHLADLNNDGNLDVIDGTSLYDSKIYFGNGSPDPFTAAPTIYAPEYNRVTDIITGDMDGDGDIDIVTASTQPFAARVYLNDGSSNPFNPSNGIVVESITSDERQTYGVDLADIDGDGDIDIILARQGNSSLFINNGTANPFTNSTEINLTTTANDYTAIGLGDIDKDGDIDIVLGAGGLIATGTSGAANSYILNTSAPSPVLAIKQTDIGTVIDATRNTAVNDINNDGYPDLITANDGVNNLYINNQTSNPFFGVTPTPITSDSHNTYDIKVADLNNDGLNDVVVGNWSSSSYYYLNDGNGNPFDTLGGEIFSAGTATLGIDIVDIDQDGDLDIIAGNFSSIISNQIFINNGSPAPFSDGPTPVDSDDKFMTWSIKAVDFDLDGDLDIVTGDRDSANHIYINDGTNAFGTSSGFTVTADNYTTRGIAVGDVNGDRKPDLVTANTAQANRLYLNDGFENPFDTVTGSNITSDLDASYAVSLVDFDKDGDLDLITANNSGGDSKLYLNNGTIDPFNGATGIVLLPGTNPISSSSVADLDRDGAVDIVLGSNGSITSQLVRSQPFDNAKSFAESIEVDTDTDVLFATLSTTQTIPNHTSINWYLSNDGGANYYKVQPGVEFGFPTFGDDLRWKAELNSLSSVVSPFIDSLTITARYDHDQDMVADDVDICVGTYDPLQLDSDTLPNGTPDPDGTPGDSPDPLTSLVGGDACDIDDDNDGTGDIYDLFPFNPNEVADTDGDCGAIDYNLTTSGDGCGDNSDIDIDDDGILNGSDPFIFNVAPSITGIPSTEATPDVTYSFTPVVSDGGDGPSLSASLLFTGGDHTNLPAWLSFNTTTGVLAGVPSNDDYGTVSNIVISVSDGTETASLATFNIDVIDTRAPQTFAVPGAGNFNEDAVVTIACFENIGSGCASISYSLDGSTYTTVTTPSTTVTIPSSMGSATLYYYSVDNAVTPNTESEQTQVYTFDLVAPVVNITAPTDGSILTVVDSINGSSSDTGTGIADVSIQITDGTNSVQVFGEPLILGAPEWLSVSSLDGVWSYDTLGLNWSNNEVPYTITARATDNTGNITTTSVSYIYFAGTPSTTTLDLSLTNTSIAANQTTDAFLTLTRLNDLYADLTGIPLALHITKPDLSVVTVNGTTNYTGNLTLSELGDDTDILFDTAGVYSMVAEFTDTTTYPNLAVSTSNPISLLVGTSAGYAIIVQGKLSNEEGLDSHNKTANRIYKTFKDRGFADEDIFYFNYDINQTGVDAVPDKATIQKLIEGSANGITDPQLLQDLIPNGLAAEINSRPAPVYLVMVDHGGKAVDSLEARFFMNDEMILPSELNLWLGSLEANMDALNAQLKVDNSRIVIIGACYSGGFISDIAGDGRIVITSSTENEPSYKGPIEDDGIRVGEYFLEELFLELGVGNNLRDAFKIATNKTESYTKEASGDTSTNSDNEFLDIAVQHPLLDDNADGAGTNAIFDNSADGLSALDVVLGFDQSALTNDAFIPADVVSVSGAQYLDNATSNAALTMYANDPSQVNQAYVEIRTPQTVLINAVESTTEQLTSDFIRRAYVPPVADGQPYTLDYTDFVEPGKYEIFSYVNDRFTGALSSAKRSIIYKNRADTAVTAEDVDGINDAPTAFTLQTPNSGVSGPYITGFTWDASTDPDQDAVSYSFYLADDINFNTFTKDNGDGSCTQQNEPYVQEELTGPSTFVDAVAGLCDGQTYIWKVEAIDPYGLHATSSNFSYTVSNNLNADIGVIVAMVKSATTNQQLTAANITNGAVFDESAIASTNVLYNGNYVLFTSNTGVGQTITASLGEYASKDINLANVTSGETIEILFNMDPNPLLDTDGDGFYDTGIPLDNCPVDINADQADLDGDGEGDVCDDDIDGDGMLNTYEVDDYPSILDPLDAADATLDPDGDTLLNLTEYRNGTNPTIFDIIPSDVDGDGIDDSVDNCLNDYNPDQLNTDEFFLPDGDALGDVCDTDDDADGMTDVFEILYGLDPIIDDAGGDLDVDGFTNLEEFNNDTDPTTAPGTTTDIDGDGVFDAYDNCPSTSNTPQLDFDSDSVGDACDTDDDNDTYPDVIDDFILNASEWLDTDSDGIGNNNDPDDDDDTYLDGSDAFQFDSAEWLDTDGDGVGDNADGDDDNDGVADGSDAFSTDNTEWLDTDGNGTGNNTDNDDDGDGVLDVNDAFPLDNTEDTDTDGDGIGDNTDGDIDGDGVLNGDDAFELDSTEWLDTDLDTIGNNADDDDDGDGMSDAFEILYSQFPDTSPGLDSLVVDDAGDLDGDGVTNINEFLGGTNPLVVNSDTTDSDGDGVTDVTDNCPDVANGASEDNQLDTDGDLAGDACDEDDDNDGVADGSDAFKLDNTEWLDTDIDTIGNNADDDDDGDGVLDVDDAFPLDATEDTDTDRDGIGDNTDGDIDGDGVDNASDAFDFDATESVDTDLDTIGNNADDDDDNDGMSDAFEILYSLFPDGITPGLDSLSIDATGDLDGDGVSNYDEYVGGTNPLIVNSDTIDTDTDGVLDVVDNCPAIINSSQLDTDSDGTGDACDPDDDNDGVLDGSDWDSLDATESADFDGNGTGDNADTDDDGDGMSDAFETLYSLDPRSLIDDATTDADGDGISNLDEYLGGTNPNVINSDTIDTDLDGVRDYMDNCPVVANGAAEDNQLDTDGDSVGDACDADDDNDNVIDTSDLYPLDPTESADFDGDSIGNNADTDDDNDGMSDEFEILYALNPFDAADAADDNDADGTNNLQEFQAGTSPLVSNAVVSGTSTPTSSTSSNSSGSLNPLFLLALLINLRLFGWSYQRLNVRSETSDRNQ